MRRLALLASLLCSAAIAGEASAQQPLPEFLRASHDGALDVREARAALRQAQSQVDEARARLLPGFNAQAAYQRNEFEAAFASPATGGQVVIQPYDSLTASFTLSVPLIDVPAWAGFFQSEALADASEAQLESADQIVQATVVQIWHQLVAMRALVSAAHRNLELAERNRVAAAARVEVGVAPQLELSRADAEIARARQSLAEAELQGVLAARNLENLTGLAPSDAVIELADDLAEEEPLAHFVRDTDDLPGVRAAREAARAARIARDTAWTALLPVIGASARETGSNVGGFTGQNWSYALAITASWQIDFLRPAALGTRSATAELAAVRAERAAQQTDTAIFEAWHRIESARARAEAANAALDASRRAADDARARFESGTGTQLEQIQAERDLFQSEVARIQAIADLRVARMVLRIRSGQALSTE
jgi:outer membrane protein TolC